MSGVRCSGEKPDGGVPRELPRAAPAFGPAFWPLLVLLAGAAAAALARDLPELLPGEVCAGARLRRAAAGRRYSAALVRIAGKCAALGLREEGAAMLEKIARLQAPESDRRPWQSDAGPADGDAARAGPGKGWDGARLPPEVRDRLHAARQALADSAPRRGGSDEDRAAAAAAVEEAERRARRAFVGEVSRVANDCAGDGLPALGYDVVLWALAFDPGNARLRSALGQKPWRDERTGETRWYAPFDLALAASGRVDDPRYGWVTPDALRRLEAGEARFDGRWLPRERVEKLRRHWSGRWRHETEHFVIHTNTDRPEAVRFGREIERFYSFLFRALADFFALDDPAEATRLVLRRGKDLGRRKLRLHVHRSRASYLWEIENDPVLRPVPRELVTPSAGFYWGQNGRAYFHCGPGGPDFTTVFHEVTHQIIGEVYPAGVRPPAWLTEGIAVFLESPVLRGPPGHTRMAAGTEPPPGTGADRGPGEVTDINAFVRTRGTSDSFHAGRRHEHYATAGAIVHFFLLHRDGIHRRPFLRYAREAYRNDRPDDPTPPGTLYKYLGLTEDELQREWESFNRRPAVYDF